MLKYFQSCKTKQDAKKQFREYVKMYHPDRNLETDTNAIMAEIIKEYESIIKRLPNDNNSNDNVQRPNESDEAYNKRISDEMREILDNISHLPLDIEIIGTWIWVSGNTYPYRSYLTAHNFIWSPSKHMFYWHMEPKRKRYGKTKAIEEIRMTYGSTKVPNKFRPELTT